MFGQNCTNVFTSRLGDGRSERSEFSMSWATFEREYYPKPCVLVPETPLFLTICHFPDIQRSHNTRSRTYINVSCTKRRRFVTVTRHEKGGPSRVFKYNSDNHSLWGYLFRSHVYSIMTLPTQILFI